MKPKSIHIYVEGPSDKLGMERLLAPIIERAEFEGNSIDFHAMGGKKPLLNKGPLKAINILRNTPDSWVFIMPDLYPPNTPFKHETFVDLKSELEKRFSTELRQRNLPERIKERFRVHCFKYDFEVLVLASEYALMERLEDTRFTHKWKKPVENQNHQQPPKRIVEALFKEAGKKYKDTVDAPFILERSDYNQLEEICNQQFKPFLKDLRTILFG